MSSPFDPIEQLEKQATELEQRGQSLLDAATKVREIIAGLASPAALSRPAAASDAVPTSSRLDTLSSFLAEHGPTTRKEIEERELMPPGTINFLLNRKNFSQDNEGRWSVRVSSSEQGQSSVGGDSGGSPPRASVVDMAASILAERPDGMHYRDVILAAKERGYVGADDTIRRGMGNHPERFEKSGDGVYRLIPKSN